MHPNNWKTIWITGASSGIGIELVEQLAATGANIAISARSQNKLNELALEYSNIHAYPLDVVDAKAVAECAASIEADLGPIDLAIFNAGVSAASSTAKPAAETFKAIMDTNFLGVTNGLSAIVPSMSERGSGHISWVGSLGGYNGLPGAGAYNASKAALMSLAESSRLELAQKGIDLSIIAPGFIRTSLTAKNKFLMPFLMEPDQAARKIIRGLMSNKYEVIFPWPMAWLTKFLRLMPYPVFFWIVKVGIMSKTK